MGARSIPTMECFVGDALKQCIGVGSWQKVPTCFGHVLRDCGGSWWRGSSPLFHLSPSYCRSAGVGASSSPEGLRPAAAGAIAAALAGADAENDPTQEPCSGLKCIPPTTIIGASLFVLVAIAVFVVLRQRLAISRRHHRRRTRGSIVQHRNSLDLAHGNNTSSGSFHLSIEGSDPNLDQRKKGKGVIPDDWGDLGLDSDSDDEMNWELPVIISKSPEHPLRSALKKEPLDVGGLPSDKSEAWNVGAGLTSTPLGPASMPNATPGRTRESTRASTRASTTSQTGSAPLQKKPSSSFQGLRKDKSAKSMRSWWSRSSFFPEPSTIAFDEAPAEVIIYTPENSMELPLTSNSRDSNISDMEADWEALQSRFSAWSAAILADDNDYRGRRSSQGSSEGRNSNSSLTRKAP